MSVVGIIAEYNPVHEGNADHLKKAREITAANACVCVLSSNFVQRGEPSIISKWARAKMALHAGADLVLELPSAFSCSSAEYFASAGVSILESLGCVDYLCFGSEMGNINELDSTAELLAFESDDFKERLKLALNDGLSFAAAREKALLMQPGFLNKPNNILGIEYIKAIKRFGSTIKPITIEREGQGYHSLERAAAYSSATAIRHHIEESPALSHTLLCDQFLNSNLPNSSLRILEDEFRKGRGPVFSEAYQVILFHLLRSTPEKALSCLPYVGEGLENRLKQFSMEKSTYKDLVSATATSRYPVSRIKRILCSLMTGMSSDFLNELKDNGYAQYVRVLGFNDCGRKLLSGIKKKASLPFLNKSAYYKKLGSPLAIKLFEHEIRSTDTYLLGYPNVNERIGGTEFIYSPFYLA